MKNHPDESGVALISALALVATLSLLVASAVVLTQFSSAEVNTFDALNRSYYAAESAANRAMLLLAQDRNNNPNRNPGEKKSDGVERFMADGRLHTLTIYSVPAQVRILDALGGLDISGAAPGRQLVFAAAPDELKEELAALADRVDDYVDRDDLVRLGGMERGDYRAAGIPELPRNRPLQFREELRFISGIPKRYSATAEGRFDAFRLIAPEKLKVLTGRPNLYSTPLPQIAERCRLDASEQELLGQAFPLWFRDGKPLEETLPPGLFVKVTAVFTQQESGVYRICVNTAMEENPGIQLYVTLLPDFSTPRIEYYEFTAQ